MVDDRTGSDIHAPVEDTRTPLSLKILTFAMFVVLLLEVAAYVQLLVMEGLLRLPW